MLRRRLRSALLVCALCLLALPPAQATVLQGPVDVETMTRQADAVVRARVLQQESHWGAEGPAGGTVFTTALLVPLEWWKGAPEPGSILVRTPGGSMGELTQEVQGSARFRTGDEVVVFLTRRAPAGARARAREAAAKVSPPRANLSEPHAGLDLLPDLAVYEVHLWTMGKFALGQASPAGRVRALRDRQGILCRGCGADDDDLTLDDLRRRVEARVRSERESPSPAPKGPAGQGPGR